MKMANKKSLFFFKKIKCKFYSEGACEISNLQKDIPNFYPELLHPMDIGRILDMKKLDSTCCDKKTQPETP